MQARFCVLLVSACWLGMTGYPAAGRDLTPDSELLRYHERFQRQAHNAYEREWLNALDAGIFNVEIDIRNHNPYNGRQDWKVRHHKRGGNKNKCGRANQSFAVCLRDLRQWHDNHPGHYPITVVIDKKDFWQPGKQRGPSDFDQRLARELGAENIFRPTDLRAGFRTLREAAGAGAWPTLTSLRGKFVILMTPHEALYETRAKANSKTHEYVNDRQANALAFVCPRGHVSEIAARVAGFTDSTSQWVVCFNHKEDQIAGDGHYGNGLALRRAGYVLRVWAVENEAEFKRAVNNSQAVFVAIDWPAQFGHYNEGHTEGGYSTGLLGPLMAAQILTIPIDRPISHQAWFSAATSSSLF